MRGKLGTLMVLVAAVVVLLPSAAQAATVQLFTNDNTNSSGWFRHAPQYQANFHAEEGHTYRELLTGYTCTSSGDSGETVLSDWEAEEGTGRSGWTTTYVRVVEQGSVLIRCTGRFLALERSCSTLWGCSTWSETGTFSRSQSASARIDYTPPTALFEPSRAPNEYGWYNAPFTVTLRGVDAHSGVRSCGLEGNNYVPPAVFEIDHESSVLTGFAGGCRDWADNVGRASFGYRYDPVPPSLDPVVPSPLLVGEAAVADPNASDDRSGVRTASCDPLDTSTAGNKTVTCTATDWAGNTAIASAAYEVAVAPDTTAPTSSADATTDGAPYSSGAWTNQDVEITLSGQDEEGGSGLKEIRYTDDGTDPSDSEGTVYTGPFTVVDEGTTTIKFVAIDNAGNVEGPASSFVVNIDKTAPTVTIMGPEDGSTYYQGHVPAAGCMTTDEPGGSGVKTFASPRTTGGPLGSVTVTCDGAEDNAGNITSTSVTFTVLERTSAGYQSPVRLGTNVVNQVRAGSTVPLRFQVFESDGTTQVELTDPSILTFRVNSVGCDGSDDVVPVAETTAGNTSLRYDTEDGQFIQNWKTPRATGCYNATITVANGPVLTARFQTR